MLYSRSFFLSYKLSPCLLHLRTSAFFFYLFLFFFIAIVCIFFHFFLVYDFCFSPTSLVILASQDCLYFLQPSTSFSDHICFFFLGFFIFFYSSFFFLVYRFFLQAFRSETSTVFDAQAVPGLITTDFVWLQHMLYSLNYKKFSRDLFLFLFIYTIYFKIQQKLIRVLFFSILFSVFDLKNLRFLFFKISTIFSIFSSFYFLFFIVLFFSHYFSVYCCDFFFYFFDLEMQYSFIFVHLMCKSFASIFL